MSIVEDKKDPSKELSREQRLEIEEKALQALLAMGAKFKVPLKIPYRKPPKMVTWWNRHFPQHLWNWRNPKIPKGWDVEVEELPDPALQRLTKQYVRNLRIAPLYLGTIDLLRKLYIKIEYDEKALDKEPIEESKKFFKHIPVLAEIAAVAIVNAATCVEQRTREVAELKQFLIEHLTVGRLQRLCDAISQMMNPAGFTYSIRSIREVGVTKPKPTEPKAGGIE